MTDKPNKIFAPRKTIPAELVGVSLTISDEAIAEGRRISLEQALAMRKLKDFVWD